MNIVVSGFQNEDHNSSHSVENLAIGYLATGDLAAEMVRDPQSVAHAARQALQTDPQSRPALQVLAGAMRQLGDRDAAERAEVEALRLSLEEPLIQSASAALTADRAGEAERHIRDHLGKHPNDAAALRIMADIAARAGRPLDAERLLRRALYYVPAFVSARKELAILLQKEGRPNDAIAVVDARLADFPKSPDLLHLKGALLERSGRIDEAIAASATALSQRNGSAVLWLSHGRLLASTGRRAEAVAAFRAAARIDRTLGAAWWGIADTDATAIDEDDVATMRSALTIDGVEPQQLVPIHFALGRLHEHRREGEAAFLQYKEGHSVRRRAIPYEAADLTHFIQEHRTRLSREFFTGRNDYGDTTHGPIFVIGMHRAGSTLVEQILASHPMVEGLAELPNLGQIARRLSPMNLARKDIADGACYLDALISVSAETSRALGGAYLEQIAQLKRSTSPYFVDKMPGNWRLIPLIRLLLPSAKIIDVRRDPLDCCISNFCRYYANGQDQADDLHDLGRYYRDYVAFMDLMDAALPGRIHRIQYEQLVDNTEAEVARLLAACSLPFDDRCLRFFETDRAVRTPSAQQVRRPLNRDGIGRWHLFAPWLQPLADGLEIDLPAF